MNDKQSKILHTIYDIIIAVLAVISITLAVLDICGKVNSSAAWYIIVDSSILVIFAVDYIARFIRAPKGGKFVFFKKNIFDLLAILPIDAAFSFFRFARLFRVAKFARLFKFAKMSKFARIAGVAGRLQEKIKKFLHTNGFIYMLYIAVVLILTSAVLISRIEEKTFGEALWWAIVTTTTVGYGDISPSTGAGRFVAVILMIFGIGLISMLTGTITSFFAEKKDELKNKSVELENIIAEMSSDERQQLTEIAKIIHK